MGYPDDLITEVEIDAYDIVEYVRQNWDFFKEKCDPSNTQKFDMQDLCTYVKDALDEFDDVRILRDSSHEYEKDEKVLLYNHLYEIYNRLNKLSN